jgi:hypothetical protein
MQIDIKSGLGGLKFSQWQLARLGGLSQHSQGRAGMERKDRIVHADDRGS